MLFVRCLSTRDEGHHPLRGRMLFIVEGGDRSSREGAVRRQGREDTVHPLFVNEGWGTPFFEREDVVRH